MSGFNGATGKFVTRTGDVPDDDPYVSGGITRAGKLAWFKRAIRAGGGYRELLSAHPAKLAALEGVDRDRRELLEAMRRESDGHPFSEPVADAVPAMRVLVTHPMRVRGNASYLAANGAVIPVEPAPGWEVKLDVRFSHHVRTGIERLAASGRDMGCYSILPDGSREPFIVPAVERETSATRRKSSAVDVAASYVERVARYGANIELADE